MRRLLIGALLCTACTRPTPPVEEQTDAAPPAVTHHSPSWAAVDQLDAHLSEDGKYIYGIGKARGIRNRSLLQSTADNRARASIARFLADGPVTLTGVEIIDRFVDEEGVMFALARMPVR